MQYCKSAYALKSFDELDGLDRKFVELIKGINPDFTQYSDLVKFARAMQTYNVEVSTLEVGWSIAEDFIYYMNLGRDFESDKENISNDELYLLLLSLYDALMRAGFLRDDICGYYSFLQMTYDGTDVEWFYCEDDFYMYAHPLTEEIKVAIFEFLGQRLPPLQYQMLRFEHLFDMGRGIDVVLSKAEEDILMALIENLHHLQPEIYDIIVLSHTS